MLPLSAHFDQFLRERVYLHNVSPKTAEWYRSVWQVFAKWWMTLPTSEEPRAVIYRSDLQQFVVHLRDRGVKPVSCNCYLRGINAFCRWLHQEGHIPQPVRLPPLKLEKRLLPLHSERALRLILTHRPLTFIQWRVYAIHLPSAIIVANRNGLRVVTHVDGPRCRPAQSASCRRKMSASWPPRSWQMRIGARAVSLRYVRGKKSAGRRAERRITQCARTLFRQMRSHTQIRLRSNLSRHDASAPGSLTSPAYIDSFYNRTLHAPRR